MKEKKGAYLPYRPESSASYLFGKLEFSIVNLSVRAAVELSCCGAVAACPAGGLSQRRGGTLRLRG